MRNLLRRLHKLEGRSTDASGLVPHSEAWFAYYEDQYRLVDGEDVPRIPLAVIDRIVERGDRAEAEALRGGLGLTMRRQTLTRIHALERSLAPVIDPVLQIVLRVNAAVSKEDLRVYARIEARPESERTETEQSMFARCELAYRDAFSVWSSDELKRIAEGLECH